MPRRQIKGVARLPYLPLGQGHIRTQTHDYYRNGTVTLFAALDYLEGKVIAHTAQKHTHRQWLEILKQIDREISLEPAQALAGTSSALRAAFYAHGLILDEPSGL